MMVLHTRLQDLPPQPRPGSGPQQGKHWPVREIPSISSLTVSSCELEGEEPGLSGTAVPLITTFQNRGISPRAEVIYSPRFCLWLRGSQKPHITNQDLNPMQDPKMN